MLKTVHRLHQLLYRPQRVLVYCLVLFFGSVLINGNVYRLAKHHVKKSELEQQIENEKIEITKIQRQLRQVNDSQYIERQARERLDLVEKDDLLFVFSEE